MSVELDRQVAEAIGCPVRVSETEGVIVGDNVPNATGGVVGVERQFHPSEDLNDAFYAAEQVGLLTLNSLLRVGKVEDEFVVWWRTDDGFEDSTFADTPAQAICNAILKLKEQA